MKIFFVQESFMTRHLDYHYTYWKLQKGEQLILGSGDGKSLLCEFEYVQGEDKGLCVFVYEKREGSPE